MIAGFAQADGLIIERSPGMARLLDQNCSFCGRRYRTEPCGKSDHYRTMIDLALEEADRPHLSFACSHPSELQAALAADRARRHPYSGRRPDASGYCVDRRCACECHKNEPIELGEEI